MCIRDSTTTTTATTTTKTTTTTTTTPTTTTCGRARHINTTRPPWGEGPMAAPLPYNETHG
eukprot:3296648-Pyramimonas_sp.AAC.1